MTNKEALSIWTVYDNPVEYPGKVVARLFIVDKTGSRATESIIIAESLEVLRTTLMVEMGLTCMTRSPTDEPHIVEVWL